MAREIRKKVKNGVLYTDGHIRIDMARFSYPHLAKAYKGDGDAGEAKFGVVGMLDKTTHKEVFNLFVEVKEEILKTNKVKALTADKLFYRDGDESGKAEYEGHWTVSARETRRPPLRNQKNEVVEPEDANEIFQPGYYGSILIRPWFQNNNYGKRLNAGLASAQFIKKGELIGEGGLTEDDLDDTFESYDGGDDSYDDDDGDDI